MKLCWGEWQSISSIIWDIPNMYPYIRWYPEELYPAMGHYWCHKYLQGGPLIDINLSAVQVLFEKSYRMQNPNLNLHCISSDKLIVHTLFCFVLLWLVTELFSLNLQDYFTGTGPIVLLHNNFSPSGEQSKNCKLAHELLQPIAGCIAIFHKYCCYTKRGGITTNSTLQNHWGYVNDVPKYRNAGIWSMD